MDGRLVLAAGPVAGRRVRRAMGSKMPSGKWETSRISCDGVCVNLSTPSRKRASKLGTERRRTRQLEVKMTDDDLTCGCRKRRSRSNPSGRAATPRRICWRKTGGIRQRRRATCSWFTPLSWTRSNLERRACLSLRPPGPASCRPALCCLFRQILLRRWRRREASPSNTGQTLSVIIWKLILKKNESASRKLTALEKQSK